MFIGVDHGTRAIRFSSHDEKTFELDRKKASKISFDELLSFMQRCLSIDPSNIKLVALTYSMGDGIHKIKRIEDVENRGLLEDGGAGSYVGGGTHIYDLFRGHEIPTIVLPGIHRRSPIDPRLKVFSHHASPEKIGDCYYVLKKFHSRNFILCDVGANTVSVGVKDGRIIGGLDACLFSPGIYQGPLDLEAIRKIDRGEISANDAFGFGGVKKAPTNFLYVENLDKKDLAFKSLSLLTAMEISAMEVLLSDADIFVCGFVSENEKFIDEMKGLLKKDITSLGDIASVGCSLIARDVFYGARNILGIEVEI
ncbi:MAG: methanogenesis marker 12 protein [Candidatus Methanolliviera hydrocarbonicum]|uniref:UPF0285 protein EF807_05270 n=1 Tax=Candidatus Methanolliviera hydrocarbonicum TaxID=2491085 RepID=A0A520KW80_9EURY|nr:MAG: methanogenesis marker 12 protein [Candidatus Methanolliviera hydrocarbonicum]